MAAHRCIYRHVNGLVEGFTGFAFTVLRAAKDCQDQIRRRLLTMSAAAQVFDESQLIYSERDLTDEEMERVRRDWSVGRRYAPDGSLHYRPL